MATTRPAWAVPRRSRSPFPHAGPSAAPAAAAPKEGASQAEAPAAQQQRRGREKATDMDEMVDVIARLVLALGLSVRELQGVVLTTVVMKKESPIVTATSEAGRAYHEQAAGKSPEEHGLGPPAPHVGITMMEALLAADATPAALQAALRGILEELNQSGLESAMVMVKHCKIAECWDKAKVKVVFHIDHARAAEIPRALVVLGGVMKHGKAPPARSSELSAASWAGRRRACRAAARRSGAARTAAA